MNDSAPRPGLDPELVKEIFADACELASAERDPFLRERCGGDAHLRAEIENLLQMHDLDSRFMSDPAAAVARAHDLPAPESDPLPRQVGPFRLVELIGQGGFGSVYLARQDWPIRRTVALKIIKLGMDTREVIARFDTERQALAMMDHPNIARVLDAGATDSGRPYFVMELVRGVPITEYCNDCRLSVSHRLELFIPVCLAVGHAHQKGVIHRDIKPSNVLVETYDRLPVPKVIDFGVAKATGAALTSQSAHTRFRQIIGTLEYMSPEQADLKAAAVDTRSDVYSLGALLYELLTGAAPFDAEVLRRKGYSEAQRIIREVDPPRPSARASSRSDWRGAGEAHRVASQLRGDLDRVVMKCLEKDRERRYSSAVAVADDIRRYLNGQPVSAGPDTAGYRVRKFVLRHKTAVATATAVTLALLIAVVGTTTGLVRTRAAERAATSDRNAARLAQQAAEQNAAAARREAQRAVAIGSFLRDVFALAQPESGAGGGDADIREVLRRAADQIDTTLHDRPQEELLARRMLGEACARVFLHDLAVEQFGRAREVSTSLAGGAASRRSLEIGGQWATEMYLAGRGDEALSRARSDLAESCRLCGEGQPVTWELMHACALCASQARNLDETYELLKRLVAVSRQSGEARRADRLGRYLCNWAACLRDRGEYDAASAALREAAVVLLADRFNPAEQPKRPPEGVFPEEGFRLLGDRSSDMISASGWIAREVVESGDFPEAAPLLQRYISEALRSAPQGTPATAYRIEDEAMLRLRGGDRAGAASDLARAVGMWRALLGYDGWQPQSRWRLWAMYCDPGLTQNWRSPALRDQVWCAVDDMLRDHPPTRLDPREMPVARLTFKLIQWNKEHGETAGTPIAEGGLDELKSLSDPGPGLYLLGLQIPRVGDEPLRKANWLLLAPWTVEFHPIVRFDSIRTDGIPPQRERTRVISPYVYDRRQTLGLALHDGLAFTTEKPRRLQWFTATARTRAQLPAGRYRFSVSSDDGHRLRIDGKTVIDDWLPQPSRTFDAEVELTAGVHEIQADLLQESGGYLLWMQAAPVTSAGKTAALSLGGGVPAADSNITLCRQHLADKPHDRVLRLIYAGSLVRAGRFRDAASQYAQLIEADPNNPSHWYVQAALLAYLESDEEYQQLCRHMFDRFGSSTDPDALTNLMIACSLRHQIPVERQELEALLERSSGMRVPGQQTAFWHLARGLAEYRADHFPGAVAELRSSLAAFPPDAGVPRAIADSILAGHDDRPGSHNEGPKTDATPAPLELIPTVDDLHENFASWLVYQVVRRSAPANAG